MPRIRLPRLTALPVAFSLLLTVLPCAKAAETLTQSPALGATITVPLTRAERRFDANGAIQLRTWFRSPDKYERIYSNVTERSAAQAKALGQQPGVETKVPVAPAAASAQISVTRAGQRTAKSGAVWETTYFRAPQPDGRERVLATLVIAKSGTATPPPIKLPIEVIGQDGLIATVAMPLAANQVAAARTLWLQVHRPVYRDAAVNPDRGPKASLSINGSAWVGITDQTVTCAAHEQRYGCLGGSYETLRLSLPLALFGSKLVVGANTIAFRFNGTDNYTSGYRVIALNLKDGGGNDLMPAAAFATDDPNSWTAPLNNATDVAAGQRLWQTRSLIPFPGGTTPMRATCSTCHASDGRDLKYFNYSNASIVGRSRFHGLTEREGQQIASYIRSIDLELSSDVKVGDLGRPWNPPYQPGPDIDARAPARWAAGAGLGAVLETDADMQKYLFPKGLVATGFRGVTVNPRTTPIALQLHDWNAWLPDEAPQDVWGPDFDKLGASVWYRNLKDTLKNWRSAEISSQYNTYSFFLASVGQQPLGQSDFPNLDIEEARRSLKKWSAVKQWELNQTYKLETTGPLAYGAGGQKLSWPTEYRNVFEIAPHFSAANTGNFRFQTVKQGTFDSSTWYETQQIINAGSNTAYWALAPVDWNYQPGHVSGVYWIGGPPHPFRYALTIAKMIDFYAAQPFPNQVGFPQMNVGHWSPNGAGASMLFDTLDPKTRATLYAAMLNKLLDFLTAYPVERFPRDNGLEPKDYVPSFVTNLPMDAAAHYGQWANCWYTSIRDFRRIGVPEATLQRMIDWGKAMWPNGKWSVVAAG